MRILLVGAGGFVGRHLLPALLAAGHELLTARRPPVDAPAGVRWLALDLERLAERPDSFAWPAGVDLLINAAGTMSLDEASMARVQDSGARALFDLAAAHGAKVLQISALGAGAHPTWPSSPARRRPTATCWNWASGAGAAPVPAAGAGRRQQRLAGTPVAATADSLAGQSRAPATAACRGPGRRGAGLAALLAGAGAGDSAGGSAGADPGRAAGRAAPRPGLAARPLCARPRRFSMRWAGLAGVLAGGH